MRCWRNVAIKSSPFCCYSGCLARGRVGTFNKAPGSEKSQRLDAPQAHALPPNEQTSRFTTYLKGISKTTRAKRWRCAGMCPAGKQASFNCRLQLKTCVLNCNRCDATDAVEMIDAIYYFTLAIPFMNQGSISSRSKLSLQQQSCKACIKIAVVGQRRSLACKTRAYCQVYARQHEPGSADSSHCALQHCTACSGRHKRMPIIAQLQQQKHVIS